MRSKTLMLFTTMTLWVALALSVQLSAQTITTFDAPGAGLLRAADGTFTTFDATPKSFWKCNR